jgi:hypothetical protein
MRAALQRSLRSNYHFAGEERHLPEVGSPADGPDREN